MEWGHALQMGCGNAAIAAITQETGTLAPQLMTLIGLFLPDGPKQFIHAVFFVKRTLNFTGS